MNKQYLAIKLLFLFTLLFQFNFIIAQDDSYTTGIITQATVNYTTPKKWTITSKLEYRNLFYEGIVGQGIEDEWRQERMLLGPMISKRISARGTFGIGVQGQIKWRSEKASDYNYSTIIQIQYSLSQKYSKFKASHRFLFDPTIQKAKPISYRLRYRYNVELPLNGTNVDVGEWYLKVGIENLLIYKTELEHEVRIGPFFGYLVNKSNKFEIGLDYRFTHAFKAGFEHQLWLNLGWYYSIPTKEKKTT